MPRRVLLSQITITILAMRMWRTVKVLLLDSMPNGVKWWVHGLHESQLDYTVTRYCGLLLGSKLGGAERWEMI